MKNDAKFYILHFALRQTRMHPGISLRQIAAIIKAVFAEEEVKSLVEELK